MRNSALVGWWWGCGRSLAKLEVPLLNFLPFCPVGHSLQSRWQRLFLQDAGVSIWMSWIFSFRFGSCIPVLWVRFSRCFIFNVLVFSAVIFTVWSDLLLDVSTVYGFAIQVYFQWCGISTNSCRFTQTLRCHFIGVQGHYVFSEALALKFSEGPPLPPLLSGELDRNATSAHATAALKLWERAAEL